MANKKINLKDKLRAHKFQFGLLQKNPCSKEENTEYKKLLENGESLPEGVFPYVYFSGETSTDEFYTVCESDLTEEEIKEYLTYKKLHLLRSIKNCLLFFVVLTILTIVLFFLGLLNG